MNKELITTLSQMTVLEVVELVRALEEKWGVSATPIVQTSSIKPINDTTDDALITHEDITLESYDSGKKIPVMKAIKQMLNLSLRDTKALVETAPCIIMRDVPVERIPNIVSELEESGANIKVG